MHNLRKGLSEAFLIIIQSGCTYKWNPLLDGKNERQFIVNKVIYLQKVKDIFDCFR